MMKKSKNEKALAFRIKQAPDLKYRDLAQLQELAIPVLSRILANVALHKKLSTSSKRNKSGK